MSVERRAESEDVRAERKWYVAKRFEQIFNSVLYKTRNR
jgi:hypothetical protein